MGRLDLTWRKETGRRGMHMERFEFGNPESNTVLIQMTDDQELPGLEHEYDCIRQMTGQDVYLIAVRVHAWNHDLSPWKAPAVFGNEGFSDGAESTLREILELTADKTRQYYIGGYSLAGLFALWAVYQTDVFQGAAAASPSVWFPGFMEYVKEREIRTGIVYLSLGDKEEKTRNRVMARVGDCIREMHDWLKEKGIRCTLEWNQGNHFKNADLRTAKAFAWVLSKGRDRN